MITPYAPTCSLTDTQFRHVRELVTGISGIQLPDGKEQLVRTRMARRLRALALASAQEYLAYLAADTSGAELEALVDVITTNKTSFFREVEHFRLMQRTILPSLAPGYAPIRIWSAGCSTGEEPYSIAMTARDALGAAATRVQIVGTDISARVLQRARSAEYTRRAVEDVPPLMRAAHFEPVPGADEHLRVSARTAALVQFDRLNLMREWHPRGPFDLIFCRNVMIYFDKPTQERLVRRYTALLAPGGYLMVGHAESLSGISHALHYVQPATYRKLEG